MKKSRLALLLVPLFLPVFAQAEKINSFDTVVTVEPDSTIKVEETIQYDFEGLDKHGIFRDIPVSYQTDLGNQAINLKDVRVTDETGAPYLFAISRQGSDEEIKIGDPQHTITGVHVYKIAYAVERAIGYFDNFDEIYWNATGNKWPVSILSSSAKVILPAPVLPESLQAACYYGPLGSKLTCQNNKELSSDGKVASVFFSNLNVLTPGGGLTIAVGFPKGLVHEPSRAKNIFNFLRDNIILLLPVVVFVLMFSLWWKKGRDPKGRGVIIAEYEAPDGLTPLEMAGVLKTKLGGKEISAEIIYLATKGYLKINRIEEKKFLMTNTDYELTLLKAGDGSIADFDQKILDGIFSPAVSNTVLPPPVRLSDLRTHFFSVIPSVTKSVFDSLATKAYYKANPQSVLKPYTALGVGIFLLIFIWAKLGFTQYPNLISLSFVISFVLSLIIIRVFGSIMPAKTEKGSAVKDKILGLKEYLQIAEKDRIEFHNAPEKNPQLFEKLLPYAMALGVEKAWAKEFEGIYTTQPSWYSDPYHNGFFNAVVFTDSLSHFSSAAAYTAAPGGTSGSGGGGFSGGGGGGGGGGSW